MLYLQIQSFRARKILLENDKASSKQTIIVSGSLTPMEVENFIEIEEVMVLLTQNFQFGSFGPSK